MTFYDKLKMDLPKATQITLRSLKGNYCPCSFGYEEYGPCDKEGIMCTHIDECWDREYKESGK